ncbi:MAG: hypothetical protein ACK5GN_05470 [Pseudomonadota bacterium]|jgi:hypothetical protein
MKLFRQRKKEIEDTSDQIIGGFAFFLSLAFLLPTGCTFLLVALMQVRHSDLTAITTFIAALSVGIFIAHYGINGHLSVLIHEWKHQVVSSLVGNKNKRMEVNQLSGSLQYEYTKATAHYNAFIALAPYILPVFTLIGAMISFALGATSTWLPLIIIGTCYGIDLLMNVRDISPVQTDINLIRGGYSIGVLYIIAWNALTSGITLAWAFNGLDGIAEQFGTIAKIFIRLYSVLTGWQPGS